MKTLTDEIAKTAGESFQYSKEYLQSQKELILLETVEKSTKVGTLILTSIIVMVLVIITFPILVVAVALLLGELLGSMGLGFLVVSFACALLISLFVMFRKRLIQRPILNALHSTLLD